MRLKTFIAVIFFWLGPLFLTAQQITLYEQFNGHYDFTAIGNTLNLQENGSGGPCTIMTSSSASLTLAPSQTITAAYLYWAGSGQGDFNVELNGVPITAERTFSYTLTTSSSPLPFFAAFANVTSQLLNTGNGVYSLSDLDLTAVIPAYCGNATNFGGWSIVLIYQDPNLPLNQLNVYDGLESVSANSTTLTFVLENLNVIDSQGAKIAFLAWEGDSSLAVNETLQINGNIISNPPLNPASNAFNSTNSFTGSNTLWNMDIDVYDIQNNIQPGDTSATINLTSGQDFVMINNVITVLNSQLPDATGIINAVQGADICGNRDLPTEFTIYNLNCTAPLPENTPISFYANDLLVASATTQNLIPIDGFETQQITISIPAEMPSEFILTLVVDDTGNGTGIVVELDETNNSYTTPVTFMAIPDVPTLPEMQKCNEGFGKAYFDLSLQNELISNDPMEDISFYLSYEDAHNGINAIYSPEYYQSISNPQTIYVRLENETCFTIADFSISVINCKPTIPQGFSPNHDNINDTFHISGLLDIFMDHELLIYTRYGNLIYRGNQETGFWKGISNTGFLIDGPVPAGVYYYVLNLKDKGHPVYTGWVYLNK